MPCIQLIRRRYCKGPRGLSDSLRSFHLAYPFCCACYVQHILNRKACPDNSNESVHPAPGRRILEIEHLFEIRTRSHAFSGRCRQYAYIFRSGKRFYHRERSRLSIQERCGGGCENCRCGKNGQLLQHFRESAVHILHWGLRWFHEP